MAQSDHLRLQDLRITFRLLGECRELGRDERAWRPHMLEGLRRLTGAQVALYLHVQELGRSAEQITEALDAGFLDSSQRALWAHYQAENAHRDDPFHLSFYRAGAGAFMTGRLDAVVEMSVWRRSRHYNEYVRACALNDRIASSLPLEGEASPTAQVIVLHRAAGDGPYPDRAVRLVRLFHEELSPLLGRSLAMTGHGGEDSALPPQLARILTCLLEGHAEKQIAARLGISRHTVNRHVQRLYRRYGVHSRGELMYRCREMLPRLLEDSRG